MMGYLNNTGLTEVWSRIKQLVATKADLSHTHSRDDITDTGTLQFTGASTASYDGSSDVTVNISSGGGSGVTIPAGTINIYAGASAPDGWLLCDGSSVSSSTYSDLYAAIGTTYGGTSSSFMLPNLCGRTPIGNGYYEDDDTGDSRSYTLGDVGGELEHKLTTTEMPSHNHTQSAHSHTPTDSNNRFITYNYTATGGAGIGERKVAATSSSTYYAPVVANSKIDYMGAASTSSATPTIASTGGGGYHNNMQPYIALNYIIKY
jgi:microcystin-dependent protein